MTRKILDFATYYLATGFGSGLIPLAPGTFGSLVGVLMVWLFFPAGMGWQFLWVVVTTGLAVYVSGWLAQAEDRKDPSMVVADEIVGVFVTFTALPTHLSGSVLLVGFLLFRAFDIWKPWPIRRLEKLPGGWGIVMDDVLAGVFANIILQIGLRIV